MLLRLFSILSFMLIIFLSNVPPLSMAATVAEESVNYEDLEHRWRMRALSPHNHQGLIEDMRTELSAAWQTYFIIQVASKCIKGGDEPSHEKMVAHFIKNHSHLILPTREQYPLVDETETKITDEQAVDAFMKERAKSSSKPSSPKKAPPPEPVDLIDAFVKELNGLSLRQQALQKELDEKERRKEFLEKSRAARKGQRHSSSEGADS